MICPNCQREITDGVKFCKFCGSPIVSEAPAAAPVAQPAPAEIPQPAPAVNAQNSPYINTQAPNQGMPYPPYAAPSPYAAQPPVEGMPIPDGDPKKKKKKKMSKGKKAILAIFLSLLSISIVGAALLLIFFPLDRFYVSEEVTIYYYEDGEDNKYEYTYTKDGDPIKVKKNGETTAEYEYDKGKLVKITAISTNEDGEEEKDTIKIDYEKTKDGYVGTYEDDDGETEVEVTYNKQNKLVKIVSESDEFSETIEYKRNFFGYITYGERTRTDSKGNEIKSYAHFDYKGEPVLSETYSNGVLTSSYEYKKGIVTQSSYATETDIKDGKTYVLEYENSFYDKNGNLIREETYDADDNLIAETTQDLSKDGIYLVISENDETTGYIDCELDKDGNIIKEEWLNADEEVIFYYEYKYDKHGNCIETKEYDADGNLDSKIETTFKRKPIFNW